MAGEQKQERFTAEGQRLTGWSVEMRQVQDQARKPSWQVEMRISQAQAR